MKFPRVSDADEAHINITPLIDVVFILLVFFILTTSFVKENRIPILLPEAESRSKAVDNALEVVIDADGNYLINNKKLFNSKRDTIRTELQRAKAQNSNGYLQITADARVPHSRVVVVMDLAGQLGFSNIRITTRELDKL